MKREWEEEKKRVRTPFLITDGVMKIWFRSGIRLTEKCELYDGTLLLCGILERFVQWRVGSYKIIVYRKFTIDPTNRLLISLIVGFEI